MEEVIKKNKEIAEYSKVHLQYKFVKFFWLKKSRIAWLVVFWLLHHYNVPTRIYNWFGKKREEWRLCYINRWAERYNPDGT